MAKRNASPGRSGRRSSDNAGKSFSSDKRSSARPAGRDDKKKSYGKSKDFDGKKNSGEGKSDRPKSFSTRGERPVERKSRSSFSDGEKPVRPERDRNEKAERPERRERPAKFTRDERKPSDKPYRSAGPKKAFDKGPRRKSSESEDFDNTESKPEYVPQKRYESNYKKKSFSKTTKAKSFEDKPSNPDVIRLNRYIANSGLCSRREADEYITMGLVSVNGKVVTELGYKVNRNDEVRYEDKVLRAEKPVYILMNKPKGFLTTTKDPEDRNTVMHILGGAVKERVYPVGRLDRNTTGLLFLTNDGELAERLMHPSYNVKKIYKVELDKPITKADFKKIQEGVRLEEGRAIVDDLAIISDDNKTVGIELHIGWNRVVRRIFESLEYVVVKLDRSVYAGLDKKDLPRGHWRYLKHEEVVILKHLKK